ncbi:MAG TPA: hypothetical protein VKR31_16675 [Rhizomicrobium sp.]|nr:hypothetical protein [Rhizomicrobium sp.]
MQKPNQVSTWINRNTAAAWSCAVGTFAIAETLDNGFAPIAGSRNKFEQNAAVVRSSAIRCPVDISRRIHQQRSPWSRAVGAILLLTEAVEHLLAPSTLAVLQLVHSATAIAVVAVALVKIAVAAENGDTKQGRRTVVGLSRDSPGIGEAPVRTTAIETESLGAKTVKGFVCPGTSIRQKFKHITPFVISANTCAVQIAECIDDEWAARVAPRTFIVLPNTGEAMLVANMQSEAATNSASASLGKLRKFFIGFPPVVAQCR